MFWNEKADKLLVPFMDKRDLITLSMTCHQWSSITNSRHLFSSILTAIREVVTEHKNITPKKDNER